MLMMSKHYPTVNTGRSGRDHPSNNPPPSAAPVENTSAPQTSPANNAIAQMLMDKIGER
jgi:hypothetical protein